MDSEVDNVSLGVCDSKCSFSAFAVHTMLQNLKLTQFSMMKEHAHSFGEIVSHFETIYFAFPVKQELKNPFCFDAFFLSLATDYDDIIISFYDGPSGFSP